MPNNAADVDAAVPSASEATDRPRVLVIFPGSLGDLMCFVPALRALAQRHQGASLELMARDELARFAVGRMGIARDHSFAIAQRAGFFADFHRVYCFAADPQLRRLLDEPAHGSDAVSFHINPFDLRRAPSGDGHIAAMCLDAIGEPAADAALLDYQIDVNDIDIAKARCVLAERRFDPARVLLLFPGSSRPAKNWPLESFVALASTLPPALRALAVIGPSEAGMEAAFTEREIATLSGPSPPPRCMIDGVPVIDAARTRARAPRLELGMLAGLARLSAGFVGNDSGMSHLAAASGARGVVIFGPASDSERWRPLGQRVRVIRAHSLDNLSVDTVATAIALEAPNAGPTAPQDAPDGADVASLTRRASGAS